MIIEVIIVVTGLSKGDKAYIVDNARFLRVVTVLRVTKDLCVIKYIDTEAVIRIRKSRLFATDKEAIVSMSLKRSRFKTR